MLAIVADVLAIVYAILSIVLVAATLERHILPPGLDFLWIVAAA